MYFYTTFACCFESLQTFKSFACVHCLRIPFFIDFLLIFHFRCKKKKQSRIILKIYHVSYCKKLVVPKQNEDESANSWMHKSSTTSTIVCIRTVSLVSIHMHVQQMHARQSLNEHKERFYMHAEHTVHETVQFCIRTSFQPAIVLRILFLDDSSINHVQIIHLLKGHIFTCIEIELTFRIYVIQAKKNSYI